MDTLNSYISDLSQQAPVPALKQLNQSSYLAGATEAPSPALLYPTMYGAERAGRAPEVKELQSKLVFFSFLSFGFVVALTGMLAIPTMVILFI